MWFDVDDAIELITQPNSKVSKTFYNYLKRGILIDTSPLYLMIIGMYDDKHNTHYLKHFQFYIRDYRNFIRFMNSINKYHFFITPHIFTELIQHIHREIHNEKQFEEVIEFISTYFSFIEEKHITKDEITKERFFRCKVCEIGDISLTILGNKEKYGALITSDMKFAGHCEKHDNLLIIPYQSIASAIDTIPSE